MPAAETTIWSIAPMDMLSMSIVLLFSGMYLTRKIPVLANNNIPPPVTAGLLFSVVTTCLYLFADVELEFDMRFRDLLLLVFFSTIGLSARVGALKAGGKALMIMVGLAAVFLFVQDFIAVGLALLFDRHPGYGLMAGSVSLAGGHGTAVAWGAEAEAAGLSAASEVGLVFATFGLIAGGLLGGPTARFLIERHGLRREGRQEADALPTAAPPENRYSLLLDEEPLFPVLRTLLVLAICVSAGDMVNRFLFGQGVLLPGFLTAMLSAIVLTNLLDVIGRPVRVENIQRFGDVSLSLFLTMSMMQMQLWAIGQAFSVVIIVLLAQILVMTLFAAFVVFRVMGRDYDAAVMAAGFTGLGLGATPVAIANMEAVTHRYGPSLKSLLVIPIIGAFFIDLLNAITIKFYIGVITTWLL